MFLVLGVILLITTFGIPSFIGKEDLGYGGLPSNTQIIVAIVIVASLWCIGFGFDKIRDHRKYRSEPPKK
tara:strand:+ start:177 stop:386 length:210 start_codon:yes stop_codon:yes gene_type:complete